MKIIAISSAACIAVLTCAVAADDDKPQTTREVEVVFDSLDRNHDERISKEEASREKSLRRRFSGVDASGDGYLSKAEYRARPSAERFE